jgi:hypothetical protein
LLWKLKQYGVKGAELGWFRSYLSNRSQETRFYKSVSQAINISLGVLHENDMGNALTYAKLNLFADDTLLYIAADNLEG